MSIVAEELSLFQRVTTALATAPVATPPSETAVVEDLARLRESLREGEKAEDHAALLEQWNRQAALLDQLRASRQMPQVSRDSPYFAHLRLRENATEFDV